MLYSIHEDDCTLQPEQETIAPHAQAILVLACRKLLNVAREAALQGVKSLADIPPQSFWQGAELLAGFVAEQKVISRA
jgi:hypothetical protein